MRHLPHRFQRGRIIREAGDEVPVDMRHLVAQQFVVDLAGLIDLVQGFGDQVHFLDQLNAFDWRQVKELGRMAAKHQHGPAGKELIVMEIGARQSEIGDEVV